MIDAALGFAGMATSQCDRLFVHPIGSKEDKDDALSRVRKWIESANGDKGLIEESLRKSGEGRSIYQFARFAIDAIKRMRPDDPDRQAAYTKVLDYIEKRRVDLAAKKPKRKKTVPTSTPIEETNGHAKPLTPFASRMKQLGNSRTVSRCNSTTTSIDNLAASDPQNASNPNVVERFPLVSCSELDSSDYSAEPIVSRIMYEGIATADAGMFKTFKTLTAMDVSISVASGRDFLNHFPVPRTRKVIYFSGEGGPAVAQEYARRIAKAKGLKLAKVKNLEFCWTIPKLENQDDLDAIERLHDKTKAELMVFDNLMLCLSGDNASNVFKMGNVLGNVIRICTERKITPMLIHHFKRTRTTDDRFAPGELLDLTQAGCAEVAGQWLLLTRREAFNPGRQGDHKLWLAVGGRLGHGGLHALDIQEGSPSDPGGRKWEVKVLSASEVRDKQQDKKQAANQEAQQERLDRDKEKIVEVLKHLPQGESKTAIRDMAGLKTPQFTLALAALLNDGTLVASEVTTGNHKKPIEGYKLKGQ